MSTKITYKYNGQEYTTAYQVRKAIADAERKAFGNPKTAEDWATLGVIKTVEEVEDVVPEPVVPPQYFNVLPVKALYLLPFSEYFIAPVTRAKPLISGVEPVPV